MIGYLILSCILYLLFMVIVLYLFKGRSSYNPILIYTCFLFITNIPYLIASNLDLSLVPFKIISKLGGNVYKDFSSIYVMLLMMFNLFYILGVFVSPYWKRNKSAIEVNYKRGSEYIVIMCFFLIATLLTVYKIQASGGLYYLINNLDTRTFIVEGNAILNNLIFLSLFLSCAYSAKLVSNDKSISQVILFLLVILFSCIMLSIFGG